MEKPLFSPLDGLNLLSSLAQNIKIPKYYTPLEYNIDKNKQWKVESGFPPDTSMYFGTNFNCLLHASKSIETNLTELWNCVCNNLSGKYCLAEYILMSKTLQKNPSLYKGTFFHKSFSPLLNVDELLESLKELNVQFNSTFQNVESPFTSIVIPCLFAVNSTDFQTSFIKNTEFILPSFRYDFGFTSNGNNIYYNGKKCVNHLPKGIFIHITLDKKVYLVYYYFGKNNDICKVEHNLLELIHYSSIQYRSFIKSCFQHFFQDITHPLINQLLKECLNSKFEKFFDHLFGIVCDPSVKSRVGEDLAFTNSCNDFVLMKMSSIFSLNWSNIISINGQNFQHPCSSSFSIPNLDLSTSNKNKSILFKEDPKTRKRSLIDEKNDSNKRPKVDQNLSILMTELVQKLNEIKQEIKWNRSKIIDISTKLDATLIK